MLIVVLPLIVSFMPMPFPSLEELNRPPVVQEQTQEK